MEAKEENEMKIVGSPIDPFLFALYLVSNSVGLVHFVRFTGIQSSLVMCVRLDVPN